MDDPNFKHKRRKLMLVFALIGFFIAGSICAYADLTDSSPPHTNLLLWAGFIVFCPGALLSLPLIDVEPGTIDFLIMWIIIGLVNSVVYAIVALLIGRFLWKREDQTLSPNVPPALPRE